VIVSLALVIGLSVGLTQANSGEAKITAKEKQAREWLIASGFSEASAFENPSSPQNLAVRFMAEGSYDIKEGISWIERYVLSVFYYAMNGPEWKYQFEFHEQSLPTCTWYQNVQFSGISIAFGASCDDIGRVNSLQICKCNINLPFLVVIFYPGVNAIMLPSRSRPCRLHSLRARPFI
jgi:hypothetical protein